VAPAAVAAVLSVVSSSCGSSIGFVVWRGSSLSSIGCRSWVSVVHGSGISCICCRSCLQYLSSHRWLQYLLLFVSTVSVARDSIQYRLWLQYWLSLACGSRSSSCCCCRSCGPSLLYLLHVAPVSVVCGSSSICRSWLRQWLHQYLSFVAPVVSSSTICCRSCLQWLARPGCRSWLQSVVSVSNSTICKSLVAPLVVACGSGSSCSISCCSWLRYYLLLSFAHGSSCGCRLNLWLQYLSWVSPVPLSVACDSGSSSICCLWLLLLLLL